MHVTLFTKSSYFCLQYDTLNMNKGWAILVAGLVVVSIGFIRGQKAAAVDEAVVQIESNTKWSGSILDSSFDSATHEGKGDKNIPIVCDKFFGIYSLALQKQAERGRLNVTVVQDNKTLDTKTTTPAYGMVTLSGNCG